MSAVLSRATGLIALILALLLTAPLAPAAVAQGPGMPQLVDAFAAAARSGSPEARRQAALAVLSDYSTYKHLIAEDLTGGAERKLTRVARELDEELVAMTREAWSEVGGKLGSGLDHVVPVGTLGHRSTNSAYIPGKSDKDFIPRGPAASEAARDFSSTFQRRFGIPPGSVDVNALDPTDPSSWPGRYSAATNPEKYNTVGGNKWLAREEALQKPNLWRFDPATGSMNEVLYQSVVRTPPPPLTRGDALGWFSDNTKFRTSLAEHVTDPATLALKQAKYDLRNIDAFKLAGGHLSDADGALLPQH